MTGAGAGTGRVVPVLTRHGATPDADLVFRTLATSGVRSATGLRLRLGLTAARVDRACEELAAIGAIRAVTNPTGRTRTWRAVDPTEFLPALRARHLSREYGRAKARQDAATRNGHGAVLLAAGLPADLPVGQLGVRTLRGRDTVRG
ncbi:MAG TPA: hypothetical protein VFY17_01335, partial [Pilimelia sp.]|nr:hypothetical protein [Pilimelia sp.]